MNDIDPEFRKFIIDYRSKEKPRRTIWKGKDYTEKTAKIEKAKLGAGWSIAPSPYTPGRFVVVKEEPILGIEDYINTYANDLRIIYKQYQRR